MDLLDPRVAYLPLGRRHGLAVPSPDLALAVGGTSPTVVSEYQSWVGPVVHRAARLLR